MILTFYDKNFKPISNNTSLNISEFSLTRNAVDFDDFTCVSQGFKEDVNPTFVIMKDDRGRYKYGAFAGIPQLDEKGETKLQASDLKTLFNNEIYAKFTSYTTIGAYLDNLLNTFENQCIKGSFNVQFIYEEVADILLSGLIPESDKYNVYKVWEDCIVPYLKYYDMYLESKIDLREKKIIFYFKKCDTIERTIRLWERGIKNYGKYIADINECVAAVNIDGKILETTYILLSNNTITNNLELRDIYPIKRRYFIQETTESEKDEALKKVKQEALKTLVESRFNESITIELDGSDDFKYLEFNLSFLLYSARGVLYKKLPLGSIKEDDKGRTKIVIGYKPSSIVFYL